MIMTSAKGTRSSKSASMVDAISCHVLDTCLGRPASGIPCTLSCRRSGVELRQPQQETQAEVLDRAVTNDDGRCAFDLADHLTTIADNDGGVVYTIEFHTRDYLRSIGTGTGSASEGEGQGVLRTGRAFWPSIAVTFDPSAADRKKDGMHKFHIPLLLGPYSYSTYRGS